MSIYESHQWSYGGFQFSEFSAHALSEKVNSYVSIILLRTPKSYHKALAPLNTTRCSSMTECMIIVGGQGRSDSSVKERADFFVGLNIPSQQILLALHR